MFDEIRNVTEEEERKRMNLTQENLMNCFDKAEEEGAEYIGVVVQVKENPTPEVIIFPKQNFDNKREYYQKTYDELLRHKHAEGIEIIGFSQADSFEELEGYFVLG